MSCADEGPTMASVRAHFLWEHKALKQHLHMYRKSDALPPLAKSAIMF